MEIVILVFFIAIFGGVLFLLGLIWFIFRRVRNSRGRNFSGNPNYTNSTTSTPTNFIDVDDDTGAMYAGSSLFDNQSSENRVVTETASDSPQPSDNSYSHESHSASAAPVETSYTESSYSSYDSGSSSDSSSSSDSGSSSSDSGSSSSSSD
ncbi:MAG TPA: hypothetical protein VGC97_05970 [Pyrinomonadaceae bacterium]|jgi:hypothetical protein